MQIAGFMIVEEVWFITPFQCTKGYSLHMWWLELFSQLVNFLHFPFFSWWQC